MSISSVSFKGFKGLPDAETKLERLSLLVGPNGAGKTARAHAMQLAIMGQVPGIAKTNRDIMATFGNGEKLVVEVRKDGVRCSRGFFQDKDGKVSEKFQLDLKRATRDQYAVAVGGVKLFDLGAFQKLSDQGKTDYVFNVFPPGEGYRELDDKIEAKKSERNVLQKEIESSQTTAARLHQQRATIELPAGTLAEIKAQIQEAETQLRMATEALHRQSVEVATRKAKEQAEAAAAMRAEAEKIERDRQADREKLKAFEQQRIDQARLAAQEKLNAEMAEKLRLREEALAEKEVLPYCPPPPPPPPMSPPATHIEGPTPFLTEHFRQSLRSVIDTMERTGCAACAAALVCRRELRKLREML